MSTLSLAMPDIFEEPSPTGTMQPELMDGVITEVENQLMRKFTQLYGNALSLADGVALYSNSIEASKHLYRIRHTNDGKLNNNPQIHGNQFEGLEVFSNNREGIINDDGTQANTTDELSRLHDRGELDHDYLEMYAKRNDEHTDLVLYDKQGNVLETQQLKHIKDIRGIVKKKYTTSSSAPNTIVVPADMYEEHKKTLESMIAQETDPERQKQITVALQKLRPGKTNAKDAYSPYVTVVTQTGKDAAARIGTNVGNTLLYETGSFVVGGAVWEIRDAYAHPDQMSIWKRIKRLFLAVFEKLKASSIIRTGREVGLEVFNLFLGILQSSFKSLKGFISLLGKSASQVWESICDYFSGKIKSFSELVSVVSKAFISVGIGFIAVSIEQKLTALGLPAPLGGLLAAALAGVAIVFANRSIDALLFSATSMFSPVAAAKIRREKITALCTEMIPQLIADRERFQQVVDKYYANRKALFSCAFADLHSSLASNDTQKIYASLESINNAYGATLGWTSQEEFDTFMLDEDTVFTL